MTQKRDRWGTLGFIFAASGSAIGLGNIVFFSANAYKYGAGAFYIPYLVAFFVLGIPIMILELGLGNKMQRAFPESLSRCAGKPGEFVGWWGLLSASFITMYYITILGWALGMWVGSFGGLWAHPGTVAAFKDAGKMAFSQAFFYHMISGKGVLIYVPIIWLLNVLIVWRGAKSIEEAVSIFVPLMWIMMIILILRGLTLPNGIQGVYRLFTPDFKIIFSDFSVWHGAFSQMFFTLSLGFGIMTAYASYLPKTSDQTNNALMVCSMNCGFEFIAGIAIFSLLFAFAIVPAGGTLSMTFWTIPRGIVQFPFWHRVFGVLFFTLLLMAGLSSSVSLFEAIISAVIDKFGASRKKVILIFAVLGCLGSFIFALPTVIDPKLDGCGTLGLTLLDMIDHWSFGQGLLIVGFFECIIVGWFYGAKKIREYVNHHSNLHLGVWFDIIIKFVAPIMILVVLVFGNLKDFKSATVYGSSYISGHAWVAGAALGIWLFATCAGAAVLTLSKTYEYEGEERRGGEPDAEGKSNDE
ncbi:MAG: sodium-dependent transporter [Planctomycetes bacterium]|nr:sodium-dependent transporter [Planctomycetota bacterium]